MTSPSDWPTSEWTIKKIKRICWTSKPLRMISRKCSTNARIFRKSMTISSSFRPTNQCAVSNPRTKATTRSPC